MEIITLLRKDTGEHHRFDFLIARKRRREMISRNGNGVTNSTNR